MSRPSILLVCLLAGTLVVTATAQETGLPTPTAIHESQSAPAWSSGVYIGPQERLIVVTMSQPGVRHSCRVQSISEKEIFCKDKLGFTKSYQGDEIAALIRPGEHTHILLWFLGVLAVGGGVAAGAYFAASVAIVAAAPLALLALLIVMSAGLVGMMADEGDRPETVIYHRPGTELTVKLK